MYTFVPVYAAMSRPAVGNSTSVSIFDPELLNLFRCTARTGGRWPKSSFFEAC
jgi:hypothetical protein